VWSHVKGQVTAGVEAANEVRMKTIYKRTTVLDKAVEAAAEKVLLEHDGDAENHGFDEELVTKTTLWTDPAGEPVQVCKVHHKAKFAARLARVIKAKMGTPRHTVANVAVARDIARKYMEELHVRRVDMAVHLPMAVKLVFVPDRYEVEAERFASSWAVGQRLEEAKPQNRGLWQVWLGKKPGLGLPST
jgi:hypothetical protein